MFCYRVLNKYCIHEIISKKKRILRCNTQTASLNIRLFSYANNFISLITIIKNNF